jgi:hypothetical protein
MWKAFSDQEDVDNKLGIIPFESGGKKRLGFSADLLRAGSIKIAATAGTDPEKCAFYAVIADPEKENSDPYLYMAGWKVTPTSITTTSAGLGRDESFHMYSSGNTSGASIGNSEEKNDWRLGIGKNFGVDKNGNLYASAGYVGGLEIKDGVL